MADIRKAAVTLKGNPVDLTGPALKVGDSAPDFKLQGATLGNVTLADSAGKTRIIATIPSLDTPTCHQETKNFNDSIKTLTGAVCLVVSMDLPFGQKRWCGAECVESVVMLSAHRCKQFGEDYGVLVTGGPLDRCLARAVFVVNPAGKITYAEYVPEISTHPNYDAILAAAKG